MSRRDLRRALERDAREREDPRARERSLRVLHAAYAEHESHARRRPWRALVLGAIVAVVGAAGVAAASAPHSEIGRAMRSLLGAGEPHARQALVRVPGGGTLLVQAEGGAWVVSDSGVKRRLGAYEGASWSPHGRFAVMWRGRELTAVDPKGRVRWSLPAPERIRVARWASGDGFLVAYVSARSLRIVAGDGTGDRAYRSVRPDVAPAWRPGGGHVLAYVDARGRVNVDSADSGRSLWRTSRAVPPAAQLLWSAGGEFLLVLAPRRARLYDGSGRLLSETPWGAGFAAAHAVWAPRGTRVAVVRVNRAKRLSEVAVLDARGGRERVIFSRHGHFGAPAWSPDGRWLLLPWPEADQWLFLRPDASAGRTAVANIARQFDPGAQSPEFPRTVQWCCT
ncbi:MAG: hypothetical protein QOI48_3929 [Solirubrobacteraceae bacterium]|nr:hypothetical protein [Solirubrobacteraceae bacterium]